MRIKKMSTDMLSALIKSRQSDLKYSKYFKHLVEEYCQRTGKDKYNFIGGRRLPLDELALKAKEKYSNLLTKRLLLKAELKNGYGVLANIRTDNLNEDTVDTMLGLVRNNRWKQLRKMMEINLKQAVNSVIDGMSPTNKKLTQNKNKYKARKFKESGGIV